MTPLRVGIIGAGYISAAYLRASQAFAQIRVVSCADLNPAAAEARAREFGIAATSLDSLLQDDTVRLVLNLTTPQSHVPVSLRAVEAGKHVYCEKPLGLSTAEAQSLLQAAKVREVRLGCAPDTFLGAGQQTARNALDRDLIGQPFGGIALVLMAGSEKWHPNPDFYYLPGAGPVFDMGPYYLTALVNLLGPISKVCSIGRKAFDYRTIGSGPRQGERFPVKTLTHFCSLLEFAAGPLVTFVASFDVAGHGHPPIEIYGTEGTLQVPDPNRFGGVVRLCRRPHAQWEELAPTHGFGDSNYRSLGVAELAESIQSGRPHRTSEALAFHVLEVMEAIVENTSSDRPVQIRSTCERPRPLEPLPAIGSLK
jgi:predicted dehydrogenase